MYPDWPDSDADLVPLPECPGPKLKPFDFHGPQKIEFLGHVEEGLHAHVVKIRISGQIYALKVVSIPLYLTNHLHTIPAWHLTQLKQFRWVWDHNWIGPWEGIDQYDREQMSAVYNYMEPFSAECRAYGRLQETGHEELAVRCFGYVLLDEQHEQAMMTQCGLDSWSFNGDAGTAGYAEGEQQNRVRFLGRAGRPPPLRCIVKAFGREQEEESFRPRLARQMLRDIIRLQKLGIMQMDVAIRQIIDGKIGDFSTAITMPHFITSPELNPHLSPAMIEAMRKATFEHCTNDYLDFDSTIHEWNREFSKEKGCMSIEAFPGGRGCPQHPRYNLRTKPARQPLYTFVDPRKYARWTTNPCRKETATLKRRWSGRISKSAQRQAVRGTGAKPQPPPLTARPDLWHYDYVEKDEAWATKTRAAVITIPHRLNWTYRNGFLFPIRPNERNSNESNHPKQVLAENRPDSLAG